MSRHPASFRDPSGFLFWRDGVLYRQVNESYAEDYERLMSSGLYQALTGEGLLIAHSEVEEEPYRPGTAHAVLRPDQLQFISYPYEWSFDALRDAALCTLEVAERALEYGMNLKDASAYNIQFVRGRPVFIDTLSFEKYEEGEPWPGYRQFCQHFLAPLALMARVDVQLNRLLMSDVDGVPLDLTSRVLPWRTKLSAGILMHIHLHASGQRRLSGSETRPGREVSERSLRGLIDSLRSTVSGLRWEPEGQWRDYYRDSSYTERGFSAKKDLVGRYLDRLEPGDVWDLGGNVGIFSRLAAGRGAHVVSLDADPACVQLNYRETVKEEANVLPLWADLCNPSPAIGWANEERDSLLARGPADVVMALALVHHLAIGNNVPLERVAALFARCGGDLIAEFVPKSDPQVQRMLASREDIFCEYTREGFEKAFSDHFTVEDAEVIPDSERVLYLFREGSHP